MSTTPVYRYRSLLAATIAIVLLGNGATRADVVVAQWNGSTSYSYWVDHMPDFDQRRNALPNTGSMYCVPTACMNMAAYFATHGDPSVGPGLANWQSQANYDTATGMLTVMGILMSTNPNDGTYGSPGLSGLTAWMNQSDKPYIVFRYAKNGGWTPTLNSAANHAIQGALVAPCVGWYDTSNYPFIQRDGGHCMTLVSASRAGDQMFIGVSDPGSAEGDLDAQSTFMIDNYAVQQEIVFPDGAGPLIMNQMVGLGSGSSTPYIDSLYVVYPLFVLTTFQQPNEFQWTFAHLPFGGPDQTQFFTGPDGSLIVDMQMQADASAVFALIQEQGGALGIWSVDPVTNDWAIVDADVPDATNIHVSRMRDLYIVDGEDVVCINPDLEFPEEIRITPPSPPTAITSNDKSNSILLLSSEGLCKLPYELEGEPEVLPIPDGVPTDLSEGGAMCYDAFRNAYWIVSPDINKLHMLREDGNGGLVLSTYGHDTLIAPEAVDVDNYGNVYVSTLGKIMEYEITNEDALQPVADPHYVDVEAGRFLQVARSRTNHDPKLHEGPGWRDRLPDVFTDDQTPLCVADLNNDRVVDALDLLQFLGSWGPCPADGFCEADLDVDGEVGITDLIQLLGAWGDC